MPEACFLSIDSCEYMRNGDYFPSRLLAVQEAVQLLCNAKTQSNRENTIGFLTTGGNTCNVMETLTGDIDRVLASLVSITLSGKVAHFARGLQIGALALSHRGNPRAEKRIVSFVGSPLREAPEDLMKLAKKLRKDNVAVDVVSLGGNENVELLQTFIDTVNKENNSRLLVIAAGSSVVDTLMTSPIFLGPDAVPVLHGGRDMAGALEFGFDPNTDPELAMVLRMSMEEERLRQERLAQQSQQAEAPAAAPAAEGNVTPQNQRTGAAEVPDQAPPVTSSSAVEEAELTEEEMMELALKMSLEQYATPAPPPPATQTAEEEKKADDGTTAAPQQGNANALDPDAQQVFDDEEFMKQLKDSLDEKK